MKICIECKAQYHVYPYEEKKRKFCSRKCQNVYWGKTHKGNKNPSWKGGINSLRFIKRKCSTCNIEFKLEQNRLNTAKYCSRECYGKNKAKFYIKQRKNIKCKECDINFSKKPSSNASYCSLKCRVIGVGKKRVGISATKEARQNMSKAQRGKPKYNLRGEKHWNWNGGKSKNRHKGQAYKNWRTAVFERDNYTCQNCKQKNIYLNAHHIKSWAKYTNLRFEIKNGITLCIDCHAFIDKKYSRLIYAQLERRDVKFQFPI